MSSYVSIYISDLYKFSAGRIDLGQGAFEAVKVLTAFIGAALGGVQGRQGGIAIFFKKQEIDDVKRAEFAYFRALGFMPCEGEQGDAHISPLYGGSPEFAGRREGFASGSQRRQQQWAKIAGWLAGR